MFFQGPSGPNAEKPVSGPGGAHLVGKLSTSCFTTQGVFWVYILIGLLQYLIEYSII